MNEVWQLYLSKKWVEPFLICSVVLFIAVSIVLYLLIIRSRGRKLKEERLRAKYERVIGEWLFSVMFDSTPTTEILKSDDFMRLRKDRVFRQQMVDSIVNLHQNYSGKYAGRLETFFRESGLMTDSYRKLKSRDWSVVCRGVQELAETNTTEAYEAILRLAKSRNRTLKIVALNACIRLNGTSGILHLAQHVQPVDEWMQLNIIAALKHQQVQDGSDVEVLLRSQNTTVVSLALKIIRGLQLNGLLTTVLELIDSTHDERLKAEARLVVFELTN